MSTTYERGNGKGKKAKTNKRAFWSIRDDVVRKLDCGEPEPETLASGSVRSSEALEATDYPKYAPSNYSLMSKSTVRSGAWFCAESTACIKIGRAHV